MEASNYHECYINDKKFIYNIRHLTRDTYIEFKNLLTTVNLQNYMYYCHYPNKIVNYGSYQHIHIWVQPFGYRETKLSGRSVTKGEYEDFGMRRLFLQKYNDIILNNKIREINIIIIK
jgi:hypothetical protein